MFESLTEKLESIFKRLKGKGLLKEEDVEVALKEIRLALLEVVLLAGNQIHEGHVFNHFGGIHAYHLCSMKRVPAYFAEVSLIALMNPPSKSEYLEPFKTKFFERTRGASGTNIFFIICTV